VDEHLPRVYRFALRLTGNRQEAEDLAQETYLRAWRRRGQLRDPKATSVWLLSIARNLWNDRLRRKARGAAKTEPIDPDCPSAESGPDRDTVVREDLRQVLDAMEKLPARQREVLYLFAREELSLREIAGVLDITPEAAKASLCEARKRLRQQFRDIDCACSRNERDEP
jgi:RNA polymerase sigma-70 factor, ECF subfamily